MLKCSPVAQSLPTSQEWMCGHGSLQPLSSLPTFLETSLANCNTGKKLNREWFQPDLILLPNLQGQMFERSQGQHAVLLEDTARRSRTSASWQTHNRHLKAVTRLTQKEKRKRNTSQAEMNQREENLYIKMAHCNQYFCCLYRTVYNKTSIYKNQWQFSNDFFLVI